FSCRRRKTLPSPCSSLSRGPGRVACMRRSSYTSIANTISKRSAGALSSANQLPTRSAHRTLNPEYDTTAYRRRGVSAGLVGQEVEMGILLGLAPFIAFFFALVRLVSPLAGLAAGLGCFPS